MSLKEELIKAQGERFNMHRLQAVQNALKQAGIDPDKALELIRAFNDCAYLSKIGLTDSIAIDFGYVPGTYIKRHEWDIARVEFGKDIGKWPIWGYNR